MARIVVFDVVQFGWDDTPKDNENILRPEWVTIFPCLRLVKITTAGASFRFDLLRLAEVLQAVSPSVEVRIDDDGDWAGDSLTADVIDKYFEMERMITYHGEEHELWIKATPRMQKIETWFHDMGYSAGRLRCVAPRFSERFPNNFSEEFRGPLNDGRSLSVPLRESGTEDPGQIRISKTVHFASKV